MGVGERFYRDRQHDIALLTKRPFEECPFSEQSTKLVRTMNAARHISPRRRSASPRYARRRGAVFVEAGLVLPLVLMFLLGVMEFGRYFMTMQVFNNGAQIGAEYAAKHTSAIVLSGKTYGNATSDVQNAVTSVLGGMTLQNQAINVFESDQNGNNLGTWTSASAGECVCVQITGTYQFAVPKLLNLPSSVNLTFESVMYSEGN
jgi:Flp pilus assembly protein TadG